MKAVKSTFHNITITSDQVTLEDSKIKDIVVEKSDDRKQVLHLKGKTIVEGNITFESGKGTVKQGSEVKIQGEIKGATVEKE